MAAAANEYVLRLPVVRESIDVLLGRDTHQFFPAYLHLRRRAAAGGSLATGGPGAQPTVVAALSLRVLSRLATVVTARIPRMNASD